MAEHRRFAGLATRSELKVANQLGVLLGKIDGSKHFRRKDLDLYDAYYEGRQYAGKPGWDSSVSQDGQHVPVRERAPRLQYNFAKVMCSRIASKLVSRRNFPTLKIEEDPDTEQLVNLIKQQSRIRAHLAEPIRRMCASGSVLVRFSLVGQSYKVQHYLAKWCFPELDPQGNLEFVKIQYVWEDHEDLDEKKRPKKKWFRMDLGKDKDVLYKPKEFNKDEQEPKFEVEQVAEHKLGFVQAEWMRTSENPNTIDGDSLLTDILGFVDELNYNLSQSSTAIQYNQDPQLLLKGMDEEEVEALIRSSQKGWNLGREGDANFLEAGMSGVEAAAEFRDKIRLGVQDLARVVMLDPEKMVGHAQSAKAMEVLHGPMVELIEEMRPMVEKNIQALMLKMTLATLIQSQRGVITPITVPPGYQPKSLNLTLDWPEIFPPTMEDLRTKVSIATQVASGNIISRETMMKWLAKDFGVENIEEEIERVANQPVINPFGGF